MKKYLISVSKSGNYLLVFAAILLVAAIFRFYGLSWDQNQHLHPDERFLTMVTNDIEWPSSVEKYLNPKVSRLSPYNKGYNFFVYGTLPIKIVKFASENIVIDQLIYNNTTLVGRLVSGFFDLAVVFLVFLIGKNVFNKKIGLTASFIYSISVLPIQLSHFYTVDAFLVFFLTFCFYLITLLLKSEKTYIAIFLGISFGFALASKISAALFLPIIFLGFLFLLLKNRNIKKVLMLGFVFSIFGYLSFRLADPRAFSTANIFNPLPNKNFVDNLGQLDSFNDPKGFFPPSIQWINTKPIIYPLKNMILWGLGLPLGILTIAGVAYSVWNQKKLLKPLSKYRLKLFNHVTVKQLNYLLILSWILLLFSYQGVQFVKALRYFYPIYPFLAIIATNFLYKLLHKKRPLLHATCYLLLLIWPLSFIQIYSRPHTRVAASEWIYKNIPSGSTLSCEHWDDCLPLPLGQNSHRNYQTETLEMFNPDTSQKWTKIDSQLERIDYLILSSNRVWGSVTKVPEKYPATSKFYEDLFAGRTNFEKVTEFTSYPTVPLLNVEIPDDTADETFTVYDHPKVLIYKNTN